MTPGRNDLCPCGSGRKYERCCYPTDVAASPGGRLSDLPPAARAEALAAERWEADVLALPRLYEGSDDQRPVLALVTAASIILHLHVWDIGASEPSDLVQPLEDALASGAGLLGEWPSMVAIRSAEVADLLRPRLKDRGCGEGQSPPRAGSAQGGMQHTRPLRYRHRVGRGRPTACQGDQLSRDRELVGVGQSLANGQAGVLDFLDLRTSPPGHVNSLQISKMKISRI